jgi:5-methyltetrahydrofolate--homocysteine methyltransferase
MTAHIMQRLAAGDVLVADGATGTMLQKAGLPTGTPGEAWVLERPGEIKKLHRAYLAAGSQIILTATFGATRARLNAAGLDAKVVEVNQRAAELAREAATNATTGPGADNRFVGGDIGPTGEMMPPIGKLTYDAALEMFAQQAGALAAGGVDLIWIETMSDANEARAAVEGARQGCDLPIFCTFSFDTHGRTSMGVGPTQAAEAVGQLGVQGIGANCGHAPDELLTILPEMQDAAPAAYLIAKPNAGIPRLVKRQVVYDASPEQMAELACRYVELGASVVGACCGSSPAHIAAIAAAVHRTEG